MLVEELLRCQIQEWYPAFRRHTIPTVIIPLPAAFLRYLSGQHAYPGPDADSDDEPLPFLLPEVVSGRHPFGPVHAHYPDPDSQLNSDLFFGSSTDDVYDPDAEHPLRPAFPELEAAIAAREQRAFRYEVLEAATRGFAEKNRLGQGGFGPVYRGRLQDGREVAVKRLGAGSRQGAREFRNEATLLSKVQHRNVVNLVVYCTCGADDKLLVYEYVPNESLDKILFSSSSSRDRVKSTT